MYLSILSISHFLRLVYDISYLYRPVMIIKNYFYKNNEPKVIDQQLINNNFKS
jgi:hypothetical protein